MNCKRIVNEVGGKRKRCLHAHFFAIAILVKLCYTLGIGNIQHNIEKRSADARLYYTLYIRHEGVQ